MDKKREYYCSKPFKLDERDDWYRVVITSKDVYDDGGFWDDGEARQELLEDLVPKGIHEFSECVFEFPSEMGKDNIEKKLEDLGYIHNPKLDQDARMQFGLFDEDDE